MKFCIATPEKVIYEDDVLSVSLPTMSGEITILPHHIPLVSVIAPGELRLNDREGNHMFAVWGGCVEVAGDTVTILADNAERAQEIDIERAEEARKRAEKEMRETKNRQDVDFAKLQAIIDREMNRIRVGKKYRK
ncbi:MAG TPA: ATP synthase F1 subunit epsilon [Candidatus Magasanikbacteria bacterium]|nr:MAG: ATP synthase F1 subunit epsilon [Candidatus Magasanikbacteria bacterium RIFCSPLOWO2_02_FULL_47_16]OGH79907.1 MAG: ATP synthase F1 subunit epsilon [Candidatus Magasanikbacteria bacterium RIFCSPHIGHO2_02_FULL_48_18]OGH81802.1 MAG: ATP synthase F1 subunit epsilon [Candidatus Magasanikbacteria bacterium RIFCSPLOWO2_12_FULL_47_9b]HAZ28617.1 ATP synthase F1 subunit epsilon [Candidatus Magasanikbacteria bacterium]